MVRLLPALVLIVTAGRLTAPIVQALLLAGAAVLWASVIAGTFHDCAHGTAAKSAAVTRLLAAATAAPIALSLDWWRVEHVRLHHKLVGTRDDPDAQFSPFGRILVADAYKPRYRYQHVYLFLVYPFTTLAMILPFDIRHMRRGHVRQRAQFPRLSSRQVVYVTVWKYLPWILFWYCMWSLLGIGLAVVTATIFALVTGILASLFVHVQHNTEYSLSEPAMDRDLLAHNSDIAPSSRIWTFMACDTNHHLAHHLWPGVPHFVLPKITDELRQEYGLRGIVYPEFSTLRQALVSHQRFLRILGQPTSTSLKPKETSV